MKIETLEVTGFRTALHGMRNPWDSWDRSDTEYVMGTEKHFATDGRLIYKLDDVAEMCVGKTDAALSKQLQLNGPEHCKHLRMIHASADITAPRFWFNEFDTYRAGVEKISCSTMHTLMRRPLTLNDFEPCNVDGEYVGSKVIEVMEYINILMESYNREKNPVTKRELWELVIQILPQSFLQKRTVQMSYQALRGMYRQRDKHRLKQWEIFREWVRGLPESWMITE